MSNYSLEGDTFYIKDYDKIPAFSSFLPGLAGIRGIPMWVFYTNRGQAINSFGIHNKDHAIMEFNPANTAYENTAIKGFRTFCKLDGSFYEPFAPCVEDTKRSIGIKENRLSIEEENQKFGLKTTVDYYILPKECIGALVRTVTIENQSDHELHMELLDGMAKILPYGMRNGEYKQMSNLLQSWTEVINVEQGAPIFKMMASSDDSSEVKEIVGGYFMMSTLDRQRLPILYDPSLVFEYETSLVYPTGFMENVLSELTEKKQYYENHIPCAFAATQANLNPGESIQLTTYIGYTDSVELLNKTLPKFEEVLYPKEKQKEADAIVEEFVNDIKTKTANPIFDQYTKQSYLDNFIRGGYPYVFQHGNHDSVVHLFNRKHGDPERDYNFFTIAGEYYSQGNGNYRDVCQNRRNDVFFHPKVGTFNIKQFYSLIQIDGYNPLEIRPSTFVIKTENREEAKLLLKQAILEQTEKIIPVIEKKFTPGEISNAIAKLNLTLVMKEDTLITSLLGLSQQEIEAGFIEGYWSDHWDYNLDLIENYLLIYPERKEELLFGDSSYRYYDSPVFVQPRSCTYVLTKNGVRQYQAIIEDKMKFNDPNFIPNQTNWLKQKDGSYVATNLFIKLLSLACNKFALLDPSGMGIAMDGGKPGWNDAMNGLPGLMGSSMAETCELSRLFEFLINALYEFGNNQMKFTLPLEIEEFLKHLIDTIELHKKGVIPEFDYWDLQSSIKESYRESVRYVLSGQETMIESVKLTHFLKLMQEKVQAGIANALALGNDIMPTYFTYEATKYEETMDVSGTVLKAPSGYPYVKVKEFRQHKLPDFLEGPARAIPILKKETAKGMQEKMKESDLYDRELRMYKTSVSIEDISYEIGRIRAFTPGWLERESIFLHMEYKYFLSMLKAELYDEYYEAMKDALIPFLSPEQYGRSILENSSFIASSVNPNPAVQGRGFVARLSGSTVEFLSMWIMMFCGKKLFTMEGNQLQLQLSPALPSDFFDERGIVEFNLLSKCKVIYHNTTGKSTYGEDKAEAYQMTYRRNGHDYVAKNCVLTGEDAYALRGGEIEQIEVYFR